MLQALSGGALVQELNKLLLHSSGGEALTDILTTMDDHEGEPDFHGDKPPQEEQDGPEGERQA